MRKKLIFSYSLIVKANLTYHIKMKNSHFIIYAFKHKFFLISLWGRNSQSKWKKHSIDYYYFSCFKISTEDEDENFKYGSFFTDKESQKILYKISKIEEDDDEEMPIYDKEISILK